MESKKLFIKNMVCDRCKMAVQTELEKTSIPYSDIGLGEVTLSGNITADQLESFRSAISSLGFELIEDKSARVISAIKSAILSFVRGDAGGRKLKFSAFLSDSSTRIIIP